MSSPCLTANEGSYCSFRSRHPSFPDKLEALRRDQDINFGFKITVPLNMDTSTAEGTLDLHFLGLQERTYQPRMPLDIRRSLAYLDPELLFAQSAPPPPPSLGGNERKTNAAWLKGLHRLSARQLGIDQWRQLYLHRSTYFYLGRSSVPGENARSRLAG